MLFSNWSENIKTEQYILHPKTILDIKNVIKQCQGRAVLRVVGSRHSIPPLIVDNDEKVVVISLDEFHLTPNDISIDEKNFLVTVNAGWTLGQLYSYLDQQSYTLPTQPASNAFTVGGCVSIPVHGSRLGRSYLGSYVTQLTLIDDQGNVITKTRKDVDFVNYIHNYGVMGVIISVTFRLEKKYKMQLHVENNNKPVFLGEKANYPLLERIFTPLIEKSINGSSHDYHHSFLDYHNNTLLTLDWHAEKEISPEEEETPERETIYKIKLAKFFHTYIFPSYRRSRTYLKLLGKLSRWLISSSVYYDTLDDRNLLWFAVGSAAYFMEYIIPIKEGARDIGKILEILKQEIEKRGTYILDLPLSLRLITIDARVYLALDLVFGTANLSLDPNNIRQGYHRLNQDFYSFCAALEKRYQQMGGFPHPGKMFGLTDKGPFTKIPNRVTLHVKGSSLFHNDYVKRLFPSKESEDFLL